VMASDAAKKLSEETGALIYWKDAAASEAQIEHDAQALGTVAGLIGQ
jgi:hypothetical protein